jgi:hypothetical protein
VGILIDLIASVIFTILGAVSYRYLYLPYRRRTNALSRLSPLDFSKDPVYLCYGLVSPDEPGKHYTVAQGDLSAITLGLSDPCGKLWRGTPSHPELYNYGAASERGVQPPDD